MIQFFLLNFTVATSARSSIGGFVKAIMLLGSLLSQIFSRNYFFVHYLYENNIFFVKDEANYNNKSMLRDNTKKIAVKNLIPLRLNNPVNHQSFKNPHQNDQNIPDLLPINLVDDSKIDNTNIPFEKNKSDLPLNNAYKFEFSNFNNIGNNFRPDRQIQNTKSLRNMKVSKSSSSSFSQEITAEGNRVKILMRFLHSRIFSCKGFKISDNVQLVYGMIKILKKTVSVDVMVKKFFDIEQLKNIIYDDKIKNGLGEKEFSLNVYKTILNNKSDDSPFTYNIFRLG